MDLTALERTLTEEAKDTVWKHWQAYQDRSKTPFDEFDKEELLEFVEVSLNYDDNKTHYERVKWLGEVFEDFLPENCGATELD